MAKKFEFGPDKPYSGLLSKLFLTTKQRKSLLKWALYCCVLLVLSVLQDVILCDVRLFGATTELVPCAIFLICLLEGTQSGSVFSLVASLVYLFSGTAPGIYAMVFITVISIGICIFRQSFLQKGFGTAILCTCTAILLYQLAVFLFGLFLGLTIPARIVGFLITALLSMIVVPALYPVLLSIESIGGETWKE